MRALPGLVWPGLMLTAPASQCLLTTTVRSRSDRRAAVRTARTCWYKDDITRSCLELFLLLGRRLAGRPAQTVQRAGRVKLGIFKKHVRRRKGGRHKDHVGNGKWRKLSDKGILGTLLIATTGELAGCCDPGRSSPDGRPFVVDIDL